MELLKVGMVSVVGLQLIKSLFKRLFWLSLLMMYFFKSAEAGEIEFVIKDVKNSSGVLYVQLFKGQENYQKMKVEASRMKQVNHQNEALRFETLEEGEYVLRYFHDQNGNQQHDRNLFGMPTEGYGFSNSAQPNFGAPDYQAIKFTVSETGITQNISHVIYH